MFENVRGCEQQLNLCVTLSPAYAPYFVMLTSRLLHISTR